MRILKIISFILVSLCIYSSTFAMESSINAPARPSSRISRETSSSTLSNSAESDALSFTISIQETLDQAHETYRSFQQLKKIVIKITRGWLSDYNRWITHQNKVASYVQKLPIQTGAEIYIFGDIHGDYNALSKALNKLSLDGILNKQWLLKDNCYLIFLGDYVDRGTKGLEVWYSLLKLREANPDPSRIILLRGNHEDFDMNFQFSQTFGSNGYLAELQKKCNLLPYTFDTLPTEYEELYGATEEKYRSLTEHIYNFLPVALYITQGKTTVLCMHGGLEIGFNPYSLLTSTNPKKIFMLLGELHRKDAIQQLPPSLQKELATLQKQSLECSYSSLHFENFNPIDSGQLHFLWNDFAEFGKTTLTRGSSWQLSPELTSALLTRDNINCVIRGHQHQLAYANNLSQHKGLYSLRTNPVHTIISFSSIPEHKPICQNYSFIKIKVGSTFPEWKSWHMHDGEEIPFSLNTRQSPAPLLKESSRDPFLTTEEEGEIVETEQLRPLFLHLETETESVKRPRTE